MRSHVEQNGVVVDAMMPTNCPLGSRYRDAGAGPSCGRRLGSPCLGDLTLQPLLAFLQCRQVLRRLGAAGRRKLKLCGGLAACDACADAQGGERKQDPREQHAFPPPRGQRNGA